MSLNSSLKQQVLRNTASNDANPNTKTLLRTEQLRPHENMDAARGAPTLKFSIDRILSDSSTDDHSDYSSLSPTSSVSPSPPATPIYPHSSAGADLQQSPTPAHVLIRNHSAMEGSRQTCLERTAIIRTAPSIPYPFLLQVAALQTAGYPRSPTLGTYTPYCTGATIGQLTGATRTPHAPLPAAFYFVTNRDVATDGRLRGAGTVSTTDDCTCKYS